jgi:4-phospho-D-threonate 3-dehydrogenase / 4-phospho-D-erythronate 3-dehydrogenase
VSEQPLLAVTMGDPAGIGPEVVLKALIRHEVYEACRVVVVGSLPALAKTADHLGLPATLVPVDDLQQTPREFGTIPVLEACDSAATDVPWGQVSAAGGRAGMCSVLKVVDLLCNGHAKGVVTAPISKEATRLAGYEDTGQLELLARMTGSTLYASMLSAKGLRVVNLTTQREHYELMEACTLVTRERVLDTIVLADDSFRRFGFPKPRIAVAALNPHAGEGGMFGQAEITEIGPAVKDAVARGIDARGPFPAESVFNRAIAGEFHVVVSMYHDQGHIPIKVHGFTDTVSVALGLPFIRTSVDHGTAFDIAGKGVADEQSMVAAILTAVELLPYGNYPCKPAAERK